MDNKYKYACIKCNSNQCSISSMRVAEGGLSAVFDLETMSFTTITCEKCGYTELYTKEKEELLKILADFIL